MKKIQEKEKQQMEMKFAELLSFMNNQSCDMTPIGFSVKKKRFQRIFKWF
jgi:hypothetical protein